MNAVSENRLRKSVLSAEKFFEEVKQHMDLKQYDGKCVRIIDAEGNVFDGICRYDYAEYNEAEWGRNEDCLRIEGFSFFQGDIQSVESLEEHEGPYGRFLDP